MEIKAYIEKPYIEEQRMNFIVENNHKLGYEIVETETQLQALGYTEEEKQEQEAERIKALNVTRGDVLEALIRARGVEQTDIENLINALPVPELDKKVYQSRLANALNFYREFPLFDILGDTLKPKITSEMWDSYFIKATDEETKANAWQELVVVEPEQTEE